MSCQHLICLDIQISKTEAPDIESNFLSLFEVPLGIFVTTAAPTIFLPHHEDPKRYLKGEREQNLRKETGNLVEN